MLEHVVTDRFSGRFSLLSDVSQRIVSILDIDELLAQVSHLIQKTFSYYHVGIGLIEGDDVVYRVGAGPLWDDPDFEFKPAHLKIGKEGVTGWVASSGKPLLIPDVHSDPHYVWMRGSKTKSELTVPITVKGVVIGILDIQSDQLNGFDETDLDFMQMLANQTGVAIENARLFAETQRLLKETEQRAAKLATINSIQQLLASKLDVQSIYEQVGGKFRDVFDAHVVVISTYDPESDLVEHHYAIERGVRIPWPGKHPPGGFRSRIIQTRQPLLFNANVADEANRVNQPILQGTETPKSWLGAPILVGDQVIGILSVQNLDRENAFDESDTSLLQMFAASMSVALENARLFAETQRLLKETEQRANELTIINSMQSGLASKLDMKGIYELVGGKLRRIFSVHGIIIYSFDHKRRLVIGEYAYEKGRRDELPPQKMTPLHEMIIHTGETIFIQENSRGFFEKVKHVMPMGEMPRSMIVVPFKFEGIVSGMIGVFDVDKDFAFTESDVRLMETLTNSMSVALESARLFSQMERRAEQFRVLAEVGRHIISLTNVHELVEKIARTVKETFGYLHVGIGLVEGGFVVSKAEVGKFAENYQSEAIPFGQGVWGWVAQHGQALNTNLPVDAGLGILCHLCVPLKVKNQVIGVISAESDHVDAFDQSDETILQMVGNQASVAIENVRLYEQSKQLAVLEERQRLARELHDSVTQSLYGISLYAQAAAGNIHAGEIDQAAQYLDDIQNTSQESLADMRLLIYELKPPILDKEGLISALQNRLNSVEDRTRIKSSIQTNLTNRLPSDVEKGLYQIAREALNNIIKHAFAKHVSIRVHHEPASVLMEISDDGIGFDPQNASREGCLGLINMREHAQSQGWRLDIESKPGNGTCIKVKVGQNG